MTVAENILVGQTPVKKIGPLKIVDYSKTNQSVEEIMKLVGLGHRKPTDYVRDLSVAEKQLIEIARAFSRNVKILVLDEPTSALNETETEALFDLIRKFKERGVGIIYISHRMEEIFQDFRSCWRSCEDGKYIWTKKSAKLNHLILLPEWLDVKLKICIPQETVRSERKYLP